MAEKSKHCDVSLGTCWTRDIERRAAGKTRDVASFKDCPGGTESIGICYVDKPWIVMPSLDRFKKLKEIDTLESNVILSGKSVPPSVERITVSSEMSWDDVVPLASHPNLEEVVVNVEDEFVMHGKDLQTLAAAFPSDPSVHFSNPDHLYAEFIDDKGRYHDEDLKSYTKKASEWGKMSRLQAVFMPSEPPNMP